MRTNLDACGRGADRVVPDLDAALRVRRHAGAELHGEHLGPEANPEEWPLLPERDTDPFDLPTNEIIAIVGAHGPAENHGARMSPKRFRQRIAKTWAPDIEPMSERPQRIAYSAGGRGLLMQDDQHRQKRLRQAAARCFGREAPHGTGTSGVRCHRPLFSRSSHRHHIRVTVNFG